MLQLAGVGGRVDADAEDGHSRSLSAPGAMALHSLFDVGRFRELVARSLIKETILLVPVTPAPCTWRLGSSSGALLECEKHTARGPNPKLSPSPGSS